MSGRPESAWRSRSDKRTAYPEHGAEVALPRPARCLLVVTKPMVNRPVVARRSLNPLIFIEVRGTRILTYRSPGRGQSQVRVSNTMSGVPIDQPSTNVAARQLGRVASECPSTQARSVRWRCQAAVVGEVTVRWSCARWHPTILDGLGNRTERRRTSCSRARTARLSRRWHDWHLAWTIEPTSAAYETLPIWIGPPLFQDPHRQRPSRRSRAPWDR